MRTFLINILNHFGMVSQYIPNRINLTDLSFSPIDFYITKLCQRWNCNETTTQCRDCNFSNTFENGADKNPNCQSNHWFNNNVLVRSSASNNLFQSKDISKIWLTNLDDEFRIEQLTILNNDILYAILYSDDDYWEDGTHFKIVGTVVSLFSQ